MWAVLSALHPVQNHHQHASRHEHYESFISTLNFTGIEFPVRLQDVSKFEKLNGLSINVYGLTENDKVYPLIITDEEKSPHVDLIYLTSASSSHYAWIKDLSRLLSSQYSKHNGKRLICRRCLQFFTTEPVLTRHQLSCSQREAVRVQMPEDKWLSFKNMKHTQPVPFVIYADFECLTKPVDSCQPNSKESYTETNQKHEPISFCYYITSTMGPYKEPFVYRGPNAEKMFMERMKLEAADIHRIYKHPLPMDPLTEEEQRAFDTATHCYLCQEKFSKNNYKVRDHDHQTKKIRGAACNTCNLKARTPNFIPVIFHNLSGYDSHLFIKELGGDDGDITVIPENTEKYISFSKQVGKHLSLRFLDSFRFMASSLDQLARNLTEDQFKLIQRYFSSDHLALLLRKGVYPYDYINHADKFNETVLPPQEAFYNRLNETNITAEDYEHAQKVWEVFRLNSLGEYADLYVKSDVLLLADIFENFRDVCMKTYGLDPAWYYTAPGLSWDAMLKKTGVQLELLQDYDMLLFYRERDSRWSFPMLPSICKSQ
ncbi:uncharacterized protein [Parasteatoda tepidariorum]|uniref:uncharacterized protein n=1 Tax=Parasteatoda tepidariorum TaxID=114398 RepID=UPI001C71E9DC|nr:uncharacterized protein LOC107449481 [Parasteatoda tepidariorum]